jgi:geranylgeranyl pyrophosphate synthase
MSDTSTESSPAAPLPDTQTLTEAARDELERVLRDFAADLPPSLIEIGKWALSAQGKLLSHLRHAETGEERPPRWPLFVLLSYLATADDRAKEEWRTALPAACAVEIAMAAADLIDEWTDGDPSDVVGRYGPGQALNAGNLLLVMAQQQLARHSRGEGGDRALQALLALQGMLVEAATGQHLDILHSGAGVWQVSLETSARITALKAGALIAGAFRVGALMSGAPEQVVEAATRIGRELGAIAQIENDIGDVLPQQLGGEADIKRKTDIALRKPTMPIIFTLRAEEGEPNALQRAYADPLATPHDEEELRLAIFEAGGARFGNLLIDVHRQNALTALDELEGLRPGAREALAPLLS